MEEKGQYAYVDRISHFVQMELATRGKYLFLACITPFAATLDTAIGLVSVLGSFNEKILEFANRQISSSNGIISDTFFYLLRMMNPKATASFDRSRLLVSDVKRKAQELAKPSPWTARGLYALLIPLTVIDRVARFVIGVILAPFALLSCGISNDLNGLVFKNLPVTGVIYDIFFCVVNIISPGKIQL